MTQREKTNPASNTLPCLSEFVGQKLVGILIGGLHGHTARTKTLIFKDGRGLTFNNENGSYWITSAEEVKRAIRKRAEELERTQRDLAGALDLAGVLR